MSRFGWFAVLVILALCSITTGHAEPSSERMRQPTTQIDPGTKNPSKPPIAMGKSQTEREKSDARTEAFKRRAGIAFVVLASCTLILFVLGCGSRIVVFADGSDVLMSACIFLAPVVTVLASRLLLLAFPLDPSQADLSIWEGLKHNLPLAFIFGVGLLWWAWAIIGTLASSIHHNGLIIGLVVSVLKLGALVSLFLVWLGTLNNYDEQHNPNHSFAKVLIFGVLIWFASKMVNGERVLRRRSVLLSPKQPLVHG